MFGTIPGRFGPLDVEFVPFCRGAGRCRAACRRVDGNGNDSIRFREINDRPGGQGRAHEPSPDGSGYSPSGKTSPPWPWLVVPYPDTGYQLRSIADEPGVPIVVGGAG